MSNSPKYPHKCHKCGAENTFLRRYPYIAHEPVHSDASRRADVDLHNRIAQRLDWLERGEPIDVKGFVSDVRSLMVRSPLTEEQIMDALRDLWKDESPRWPSGAIEAGRRIERLLGH